ncbi:MAG TPA: hypothetical protein VEQ66_11965 [Propionibacteriaceae bacterium]|nr:hypothetical protein [Propionibacteriaceae bacterium]
MSSLLKPWSAPVVTVLVSVPQAQADPTIADDGLGDGSFFVSAP